MPRYYLGISLFLFMAKYNYKSETIDPQLYLKYLESNKQSYLDYRKDWTPEQKSEWEQSFNNYTKALQEDINNGGGRFSTDASGDIIDNNGEFSSDSNNMYYYTKNGKYITSDQYNQLADNDKAKYQAFSGNRQFRDYANKVGDALVKKLKEPFNYNKNGFAAYWQNKYNPAGDTNDPQMYWNLDKEGGYANRVNQTIADIDDYMSNQELPENVRNAIQQYRDTLASYSTDKKFDLDAWKNNVNLAASKAGVGTWNTGFFNFNGTTTNPEDTTEKPKQFDVNNDQDIIDKYQLQDQIDQSPDSRDSIIKIYRNKYINEQKQLKASYDKQLADMQFNEFLQANPQVADATKRDFTNRTFQVKGIYSGSANRYNNQDRSYESLNSVMDALAAKADSDSYFLNKVVSPISRVQFNNLGSGIAYYLPFILSQPQLKAQFDKYVETTKDSVGNTVYKVKNSKNKAGEYLYFLDPKTSGRLRWYRSKSYQDLKASLPKAQQGFKFVTPAMKTQAANVAKQKQEQAMLSNPDTPEEQKRKIAGNQKPKLDGIAAARMAAAAADIGSMIAAFAPGAGTVASAGLGIGSTAANLGADMADDSVSGWQAAGNAALGLGLDLVGLIPGLGVGAKAGKIAKTVSKIAPTALTLLAASNALDAESRKSWSKISSPSSMTVQDWRNVASGLTLLAGGARAVKGHLQANAIKAASNTGNFKIKTKSGKELTLTPEQTKQLNEATSVEDANKLLGKWFKGEEVQTRNSSLWQYARHPMNSSLRKQKPFIGARQAFASVNTGKLKGISDRDLKAFSKMAYAGENWKLPDFNIFRNPYINYDYVAPSHLNYTYLRDMTKMPYIATNNYTPMNYNSIARGVANHKIGITPTRQKYGRARQPREGSRYTSRTTFFKHGGIAKAQQGTRLDITKFKPFDVNNYTYSLNTDRLYSGDFTNGQLRDAIISNQKGIGQGRYMPAEGNSKEYTQGIENGKYYQDFTNSLLKDDNTFTDTGLKWAKAVDAQIGNPDASFFDSTGNLRTSWTLTNNDTYNRGPITYKNLREYVNAVRNDQINGARHNVFINEGNRYFYKDVNGNKVWVDPEEAKQYRVSEQSIDSFDPEKTVQWHDYEIIGQPGVTKGSTYQTNQTDNNSPMDAYKKITNANPSLPLRLLRLASADATNRAITKYMEQKPLLQDPLEDTRYVQSDLDAENNGQAALRQLSNQFSQPISSDANYMYGTRIDSYLKGLDLANQGRQQSNQRLRETSEQALQQSFANHAQRHQTAMNNRQSLWQTDVQNRSNLAQLRNKIYTDHDAFLQEQQFKIDSDYEHKKALAEQAALSRINDTIKYDLKSYQQQYGLSDDDIQLWNDVYVNGTQDLTSIQKNPQKYNQWKKILNITQQIKNNLTYDYYGLPTYKQTNQSWTPTLNRKGGKVNTKKVREAASGEKIAIARLKANTADADRFNKSVNAFIDRSFDSINRLVDYSTKKKKSKKKSK